MHRFTTIILATAAMFCPWQSMAHTFTGVVERVIDGDTICVKVKGGDLKLETIEKDGLARVRLAEIDAPELKEPSGPESKQALSDMILHRTVTVQWKHRGKYRRIIGRVYLAATHTHSSNLGGGAWVNLRLVALGWAEHAKVYSEDETLAKAELEARHRACGMWALQPGGVNIEFHRGNTPHLL